MKKKTFVSLVTLASLMGVSLTLLGVNALNSVNAESSVSTGETVTSIYHINDNFIPSSDTKIVVGEKSYDPTNIYCIYPDGSIKSGKWFKLSSYGQYTFVYEAKVDGKLVSAKQYLSVKKDQYYFATEKSKMSYGELDFSYNNSGFAEGLCLDMTEGDTFYISEPINLYKDEVTEILNFKCVQRGDPVCKYMNVRLTDCYDPNIYIDIDLKRGSYEYEEYIQTGFKGSGMVGLKTDGAGLLEIDGVTYNIDPNGTMLPSSYKSVSEANMTINSITYHFDNSNPERPRIYASSDRTYQYNLVREFNNPDISSAMFGGFTNGNVYVSLTVSSFNGIQEAPIQIASINGRSGKALLPMDFYEDSTAPILNINAKSLTNSIVAGKKLVLPKTSALDDTGIRGNVETAVYYDYDSAISRRNVSVNVDNEGNISFTPNILGVYTVEYVATDFYGNKTTKLLTLNASSFDNSAFKFKAPNFTDVVAGSNINLNSCSIVGINEIEKLSVEITKPDGKKETINDVSKPYFLDVAGNYKITYMVEDAFYKDSFDYEFTVKESTIYKFELEKIPTPYCFIGNASYSFDKELPFIYTSNGKKTSDIKAYIKIGESGYLPFTSFDSYKFNVEDAGKMVQFKYACALDESIFIESEAREIVDVDYNLSASKKVSMEKYFQGLFEKSSNSNNVTYVSSVNGDANLVYVNPISLSNLNLEYMWRSGTPVESMIINLVDYYDNSIFHTLTFTGLNSLSIDGGKNVALRTNWKGVSNSITYDANAEKILFKDGSNNQAFDLANNFTSDKILLRIDTRGMVKDESTLDVFKICNQKLNNITTDRVQPILVVEEPVSVGEIGETFVVKAPEAVDMLSPILKNKITLNVNFNKETTTSNDGTLMKNIVNPAASYEFTINDFGEYYVTFTVSDGFNNRSTKNSSVYIYDIEAPTLVLSKKADEQEASDNIPVISFTVNDNVTKAEDMMVYVCVFNDQGVFVFSKEGTEGITIHEKGKYTVYIYVFDEAGNFAIDFYTLTVK